MTISLWRYKVLYTFPQLLFIVAYLLIGITLILFVDFQLVSNELSNRLIFFFGFLSPMIVFWMFFNDLKSNSYYYTLLIISLIQLFISLLFINNPIFELSSSQLSHSIFVSISSIGTLRSLFIFLIGFQVFRWISLKVEGREIYKALFVTQPFNEQEYRVVNGLDITLNLALFFIIILSTIIPFDIFI